VEDMSRYAARPSRNWFRMLKSNFSDAAADVSVTVAAAVLSARVQLLCLRRLLIIRVVLPPLESAFERICFDLVKIMMHCIQLLCGCMQVQ